MLKLERPIACFDLETTGLDVENDRIVQIAIVKQWPDGDRKEESWLVNPLRPIPEAAGAVHGITDADVADMPEFDMLAGVIFDSLSGCDLVGYNLITYDVPLLAAEFRRVGESYPWPGQDTKIIDVQNIFRQQFPHRLKNAVHHYLDREHDGAHDAIVDALATIDVLEHQSARYCKHTVDELIALSRDPDWIDAGGKSKWIDGVACFGFGKHEGQPLSSQTDYLRWILTKDFDADFQAVCRAVLAGDAPREAQ